MLILKITLLSQWFVINEVDDIENDKLIEKSVEPTNRKLSKTEKLSKS